MAHQINLTIKELFMLSAGTTCKIVSDYYDIKYPGWDVNTVVDIYVLSEDLKEYPTYIVPYLLEYCDENQQKTYIIWALGEMATVMPDNYNNKQEVIDKLAELSDCISNPSQAKIDALTAYTDSIKIDFDDVNDARFRNALRGFINLVVIKEYTRFDLYGSARLIAKASEENLEVPKEITFNRVIERLQVILELADE